MWPLLKDDMQICKRFHIFKKGQNIMLQILNLHNLFLFVNYTSENMDKRDETKTSYCKKSRL